VITEKLKATYDNLHRKESMQEKQNTHSDINDINMMWVRLVVIYQVR